LATSYAGARSLPQPGLWRCCRAMGRRGYSIHGATRKSGSCRLTTQESKVGPCGISAPRALADRELHYRPFSAKSSPVDCCYTRPNAATLIPPLFGGWLSCAPAPWELRLALYRCAARSSGCFGNSRCDGQNPPPGRWAAAYIWHHSY